MKLRPPTEDEMADVAAMYNESSQECYGVDAASERILRTWFTSPVTDVARNLRVAVDVGTVIGYADVDPRDSNPTRCWVELACRRTPALEPTAAELLEWAEARAQEEPDPVVRTSAWEKDDRMNRVLAQRGFRPIRHGYTMEIDLGESVVAPVLPDGIRIRTFRDDDRRAVWQVHDETFVDTWEYPGTTFEEWRHWMLEGPMFNPELWFLAEAGDELAGLCLCRISDRETDLGWVQALGVRRAWRGRGLGRALLQHAFSEFRSRGFARVGLGVDASSPTGAERLYESAGMRVVRKRNLYEKRL
jgi:mycothiol synthase